MTSVGGILFGGVNSSDRHDTNVPGWGRFRGIDGLSFRLLPPDTPPEDIGMLVSMGPQGSSIYTRHPDGVWQQLSTGAHVNHRLLMTNPNPGFTLVYQGVPTADMVVPPDGIYVSKGLRAVYRINGKWFSGTEHHTARGCATAKLVSVHVAIGTTLKKLASW